MGVHNKKRRIKNEIYKKRIKKIFNKISFKTKHFFISHWTLPFKIFLSYLSFVFIGAIFLYLPGALNTDYLRSDGTKYNFFDALFTSVSAFTNTGLSVTETLSTFSVFGKVIIYILIQVGGFGLLSIFFLIGQWIRKISRNKFRFNVVMSHIERGGSKISDSGKIIFSIFIIIIIVQIFFSLILSAIFYTNDFYYVQVKNALYYLDTNQSLGMKNDYWKSLLNAFFLVGSTINNAGFDIFGSSSLATMNYSIAGIAVQCIILFLFLFGGIGYIVIYDIWLKIAYYISRIAPRFSTIFFKNLDFDNKHTKPRLSYFSKIALYLFIFFAIISLLFSYGVEYINLFSYDANNSKIVPFLHQNNPLELSFEYKNFALFFNTLSTRSAGFSTIPMSSLSQISQWFFMFLMFIGTSPASTGGGIRTTTFYIIIKSVKQRIFNLKNISIAKRNLNNDLAIEANQIFIIALLIVTVLTMVIGLLPFAKANDAIKKDFTLLFFETFSAYGTSGLSIGITSYFSDIQLILLLPLMTIGQIGINTTLGAFLSKNKKYNNVKYSDMDIKIV